jgi:hypothetical protein
MLYYYFAYYYFSYFYSPHIALSQGKCFIDASTLIEKCSADYDNTFSCPLPAGASTECHAVCK